MTALWSLKRRQNKLPVMRDETLCADVDATLSHWRVSQEKAPRKDAFAQLACHSWFPYEDDP